MIASFNNEKILIIKYYDPSKKKIISSSRFHTVKDIDLQSYEKLGDMIKNIVTSDIQLFVETSCILEEL